MMHPESRFARPELERSRHPTADTPFELDSVALDLIHLEPLFHGRDWRPDQYLFEWHTLMNYK